MKTFLFSLSCLLAASVCAAQIPDPVPPAEGTWHDLRLRQHALRQLQPPPMPSGGFWIVEDNQHAHQPTLVRFYQFPDQEIFVDTVSSGRIDVHDRETVIRLHAQLVQLLNSQPGTYLMTHRTPRR